MENFHDIAPLKGIMGACSLHTVLDRTGSNVKLLHSLIKLLCLTLVMSLSVPAARADWGNFIVNFDKQVPGKRAQIWQIAPLDGRWTYFAGTNGMLEFDGAQWTVWPMQNGQDVRSVMPSQKLGRVYVGGINEYGYYEPSASGELTYHCMSDTLSPDLRYVGNVWGIHEADGVIYFQSDDRVVKCQDGRYTAIRTEGLKIDCSCVTKDVLYVGTNQGVWVVVGDTFFRLPGAKELQSMRIRSIVPYREGVLVATAYHGLYYCNGSCQHLLTGAEEFMRSNEVFCMAEQDDKVALGTIHKGIVLIDLSTGEMRLFNESNGLSDNTVLSLAFDPSGQLWAGLDSGIDYVWLNLPFTNLYSRPRSYGAGYAVAECDGRLYLGTNRGLYYTSSSSITDSSPSTIVSVEGCSGQVWDLCTIGGDLLCLHDRGVFVIDGTRATRITDITGAWTLQAVEGRTDRMWVGAYDGLYLLERADSSWRKVSKVDGVNDSFRQFEQESERVLWLYGTDHVTRFTLGDDLLRVESVREYYEADGFPCGRQMRVVKVMGQVAFATPRGFYRYNPTSDRMEPWAAIDSLMGGPREWVCTVEQSGRLFALGPNELCIVPVDPVLSPESASITTLPHMVVEPVTGYETLTVLNDSLLAIPHEAGFALLHIPQQREEPRSDGLLHIRSMHLSYPKDSLVYADNFLGRKPQLTIDYALGSVRIAYGLPLMSATDDVRFRYRLNDENWSEPSTVQSKEWSGLHEGEYVFEVKATLPDGTESTDSLAFRILPPWYRSPVAYTAYVMLVLLLLWLVQRLEGSRVNRAMHRVEAEKERELEQMEYEYEQERQRREQQITQLEKEKLEHDLQHKSQELLNLMINFTRKNEVLAEIKTDILRISASLRGESARENKRQLLLINNKIDANMQSDEVLKRIEEQFDLIHNNFMKRLQERHPNLSTNERMMCAYLKMDLSTKEIAPLLNMSVRGVETMRYRLRKKFGLDRNDSLTEYLMF